MKAATVPTWWLSSAIMKMADRYATAHREIGERIWSYDGPGLFDGTEEYQRLVRRRTRADRALHRLVNALAARGDR